MALLWFSPGEDAGYGSQAYSPMHANVNGSAANNGHIQNGVITEVLILSGDQSVSLTV